MNIAHIVCVFPPYKSGIGNTAHNYAKELAFKGHNILVITPDYNKPDYKSNIFDIVYIKPIIKVGNGAFLLGINKYLKNFNIVHLHYPFFGGIETIWLNNIFKKRKYKLVIHYHMDAILLSPMTKILSIPSKIVKNSLFNKADAITCASIDYVKNSSIAKVYKKQKNKFFEIPFWVDDIFLNNNKINNNNKIKILFVGGLDKAHYFKGLDILFKAVSKINRNKYILQIIGEGNLKEYYKKQAKKYKLNIYFTGNANSLKLVDYYKSADIFVLPSINKSEAFGIVLLEAMANSTPVIASCLPGVRTVFKNNKQGFLVEPKNVNDLFQKINILINDKNLRIKMGIAGKKLVKEKYVKKIVVKKLIKLYENLLNK